MRTPAITVFVVCVLILGLGFALYDYRKHGARQQRFDISKSEADSLKKTKESGAEQSYDQNYEKAIEEYKRALRISPRDAHLRNDLGAAYYRLGLESIVPPVAEDEFGFGTEVDARHAVDSVPLQETDEVLEKVDEALEQTQSGIVTAVVSDEAASREIATHARSLGHLVHTEEEEAEDGGKDFWVTVITGKTKEAFLESEKEYLKAIDIKSVRDMDGRKYSSYSAASRNLGTLYFRMGKKRDAIAHWRRAFQLEPTDAELRNLLGKYE